MQGTPLSPGPEGHTGTDTAPQRRGGRRNLPGDPAREELGGSERRGARAQGGGRPHQPGSHGKQQRKAPSRCRRPEGTATAWQPAGALSSPRPPGETLSSQSRTGGRRNATPAASHPPPPRGRETSDPPGDGLGARAAWQRPKPGHRTPPSPGRVAKATAEPHGRPPRKRSRGGRRSRVLGCARARSSLSCTRVCSYGNSERAITRSEGKDEDYCYCEVLTRVVVGVVINAHCAI